MLFWKSFIVLCGLVVIYIFRFLLRKVAAFDKHLSLISVYTAPERSSAVVEAAVGSVVALLFIASAVGIGLFVMMSRRKRYGFARFWMGSGGTGKQIYFNIVKRILGGEQNLPLEPLPTELIPDPRVDIDNMTQMIYRECFGTSFIWKTFLLNFFSYR